MLPSLRLLLATVFLVLLSVVIYALSGLSGPDSELAEAERHDSAGDVNAVQATQQGRVLA